MITKKLEDMKPGEHFIGVAKGMRGWFACEYWINNTHEHNLGDFLEPWQSDNSSFNSRDEAVALARILAEIQELPYVE